MKTLARGVIACCRELAEFSEEPDRTTRTFLSPPMRDVHRVLGAWMERIGMRVSIDAAGNLRGLFGEPGKPRLIVGSHLDTVPNAGAFDGILGVVMGIALAEMKPLMPVEVVGFSEEEGVRFGFPFIGSMAFNGTLRRNSSVFEAITAYGLDPANLPAARFARESVAYLEFHIEQGPVLESLDTPLAAVEAIAGQSRGMLTFQGAANHAGTTPMNLRRDALRAAAAWIIEVENYARSHDGLVATVGSLNVFPNAGNIIPGEVCASFDVRHADNSKRLTAARDLLTQAEAIAAQRGVRVASETRMEQCTVPMDRNLTQLLCDSGGGLPKMTSGAGHDAMIVAPFMPSTMLFLRSPGGISHHPDESVLPEDVEAALETGARFIQSLEGRYA
jgi:allantoate deiminase